jgi:hypothetical protein
MKSEEIVKQLMAALPAQTDLFTDSISVTGITSAGVVATVNAPSHGLLVNSLFTICNAQTNLVIEEIVRDGEVASARTESNHDLTFDEIQIEQNGALMVTISGATEAEFNGTFELLSVPNRTHFQFKVADSGAGESTGSPVLVDGFAYSYNGTFNVDSVIDDDFFTYTLPFADLPDAAGTITLKKNYRISRIVNLERALEAYTKMETDKLWLFVETGDGAASKDRKTQSDATAVLGRTNSFRQQVIFPFTVYCFVNATEDVSGGESKDEMRDVMLFLFRSLLGKVFQTNFSCESENQVVYNSDGTIFYDSATYAHAFQFETVNDISFGDSIGYDFNVAFRDIELGFDPIFDIGDSE